MAQRHTRRHSAPECHTVPRKAPQHTITQHSTTHHATPHQKARRSGAPQNTDGTGAANANTRWPATKPTAQHRSTPNSKEAAEQHSAAQHREPHKRAHNRPRHHGTRRKKPNNTKSNHREGGGGTAPVHHAKDTTTSSAAPHPTARRTTTGQGTTAKKTAERTPAQDSRRQRKRAQQGAPQQQEKDTPAKYSTTPHIVQNKPRRNTTRSKTPHIKGSGGGRTSRNQPAKTQGTRSRTIQGWSQGGGDNRETTHQDSGHPGPEPHRARDRKERKRVGGGGPIRRQGPGHSGLEQTERRTQGDTQHTKRAHQ